jgi:choline dehydrogenase-like flavoprotein
MPLCCQLNVQSILSLGLTVANRLTQNPEVTVLVIESGQSDQGDPRLTDPAKSVYFS